MVQLDVTGGDRARAFLRQPQLGRIARRHRDGDLLQAEQDVDDVLLDTLDARVFVKHALDFGLGNRGAGHRRQQNAPQRVAERVAESAFERLDRHLRLQIVDRRYFDDTRLQKFVN